MNGKVKCGSLETKVAFTLKISFSHVSDVGPKHLLLYSFLFCWGAGETNPGSPTY